PVSPPNQEPIFTATTTTTTTLPPPPHPQQQSTTDPTLAACVSALEQICANFEKKNKLEYTALYDALEASMDHENKEEFMDVTAKSRKRRHDDHDPPTPPPKDLDQSKKKRHDSDAFASQQPQARTSSAWKSSDTREAPSSSS
ncbi:hypothetical protein Tco_0253803, partial [Tanacetum coccineum]